MRSSPPAPWAPSRSAAPSSRPVLRRLFRWDPSATLQAEPAAAAADAEANRIQTAEAGGFPPASDWFNICKLEFVEIIISLRRLHFLAGKKWRKEPGKGGSPFAILPRQRETAQDRTLDCRFGVRTRAYRLGPRRCRCTSRFVPTLGVPTKARRHQFLVGPTRNGVETIPEPLTKSSGDRR